MITILLILLLARDQIKILLSVARGNRKVSAKVERHLGTYVYTYTVNNKEYHKIEETLVALGKKTSGSVNLMYWDSFPQYCYRPDALNLILVGFILRCAMILILFAEIVGLMVR